MQIYINKLFENTTLSDSEKASISELYANIDMAELQKFSPKLYDYLQFDPSKITEFKQIIVDGSQRTPMITGEDGGVEAAQAVADATQSSAKVFTLPLFWKWLTPVFGVTSIYILKLQAATAIPWLPFIILCGFGVRLLLAPMMIKQMTLINKMSIASPDMRIVGKLFKHVDKNMITKATWAFKAVYGLAKKTGTSLTKFYFYNLIQLPVFIIMIFSIRKICFEHDELAGKGILWFKDLNEPDPYLILPLLATILNYINLGRGITKENEHWFINRFRSFFQVLQFLHLPFTHKWPAGSFVYWIASSTFVLIQQTLTRNPKVMNWINPAFFYNYTKMYGERSVKSHENYVERLLHSEDTKLKSYTKDDFVLQDLEYEMKQFLAFQRTRKINIKKEDVKESLGGVMGRDGNTVR